MARYALVENDVVVNITKATPEWVAQQEEERWEPIDGVLVNLGWDWSVGQSAPTPPSVDPQEVLRRMLNKLRRNARDAYDDKVGYMHDEERRIWRNLRTEIAAGDTDGPGARFVQAAAAVAGVTPLVYLNNVIKPTLDAMDDLVGTISGTREVAERALKQVDLEAPDAVEQLLAVDISITV